MSEFNIPGWDYNRSKISKWVDELSGQAHKYPPPSQYRDIADFSWAGRWDVMGENKRLMADNMAKGNEITRLRMLLDQKDKLLHEAEKKLRHQKDQAERNTWRKADEVYKELEDCHSANSELKRISRSLTKELEDYKNDNKGLLAQVKELEMDLMNAYKRLDKIHNVAEIGGT